MQNDGCDKPTQHQQCPELTAGVACPYALKLSAKIRVALLQEDDAMEELFCACNVNLMLWLAE